MPRKDPARGARMRRSVSVKWLLPASASTSPASSRGSSCARTASTAGPAFTMRRIFRGRAREATKASGVPATATAASGWSAASLRPASGSRS